jgi:hypothetical protein
MKPEVEVSTGVRSVLEAVEGLRFPLTRLQLIVARGDRWIDLTGHDPRTLGAMLGPLEETTFASASDLVERLEHLL